MHFWFLLFLFFLPRSSDGQIFTNQNGEQLSDNWVFNAEFIKERKIKSINGRFTLKRAGYPMRETNYWQIFEFDSLGRISQSYETRKDDGTLDTVWTKYFYNDKGLLIFESMGTHEFFSYKTTVFNQNKEIILVEEYRRAIDFTGIPVMKEEYSERFREEEFQGNPVKIRLNKQGTPYAKLTSFFNENGKLVKQEDRFISTNEGLVIRFDYDNKGKLLQKKVLTSKQEISKESWTFSYDEKGNLIEKKEFLDSKLTKETQFLYNEISNLPSAFLVQERGSSNITILRIKEYEYY